MALASVGTASCTRDPIASSSGRAFVQDSSTSLAGSESQTTPPPTQRWSTPPATANVRMVRVRSKSPLPYTFPIAPIDAPRPTGSSSAMRSTAAIFGAPVTDPPGNVASRMSARPIPPRSSPSTVDTMCSTPASSSRRHQLGPVHAARLAHARQSRFARGRRSSRARRHPSPTRGAALPLRVVAFP